MKDEPWEPLKSAWMEHTMPKIDFGMMKSAQKIAELCLPKVDLGFIESAQKMASLSLSNVNLELVQSAQKMVEICLPKVDLQVAELQRSIECALPKIDLGIVEIVQEAAEQFQRNLGDMPVFLSQVGDFCKGLEYSIPKLDPGVIHILEEATIPLERNLGDMQALQSQMEDMCKILEHSLPEINLGMAGSIIEATGEFTRIQKQAEAFKFEVEPGIRALMESARASAEQFATLEFRRTPVFLPPMESVLKSMDYIIPKTDLTILGCVLPTSKDLVISPSNLDLIYSPIDQESLEGMSFHKLLIQVDNSLSELWEGAREAFRSRKPDHFRHFSVSLRELFRIILHNLAPTEDITEWTNSADHYSNGRPTREARLLYIFRGINIEPFQAMIKKEIANILEFERVLEYGTHDISPYFTQPQALALMHKFESITRLIIYVSKLGDIEKFNGN